MNNYFQIESLSEENILELYDEVVESNYISTKWQRCYCRCNNGYNQDYDCDIYTYFSSNGNRCIPIGHIHTPSNDSNVRDYRCGGTICPSKGGIKSLEYKNNYCW